jgi:CheY-like chemotaxis protein
MHILLVDDDTDDQLFFVDAIQHIDSGISIEFANDGEEALDKLISSTNLPDLVFLDINMPKMDGRRCLRAIRSNTRLNQLKVVVISTTIPPNDEELFRMLGAEYMVKPDDFEQLIRELHMHLLVFSKR